MSHKSKSILTSSGEEITATRPAPVTENIGVFPYNRRTNPQEAIEALVEGHPVLVTDFFSSGLALLSALKKFVEAEYPDPSFRGQRSFRSAFRNLSNQVFLKVSNHKLAVRKAPEIGWLQILYPGVQEFLLPFPQIQGLNSSWQWYKKGIFIPVLKKKIHPWFGTYFPTRFEHLELFDNWLRRYKGEKQSAFDIGTGSGVLTFQLLKYRFRKIYATDSSPNAIIGLSEAANRLHPKIELHCGNLFANCKSKTELVVFNPPWLPETQNSNALDKAIYYNPELFARFFTEAKKHLQPGGRVVLLFSNIAQITGVGSKHPIKTELAEGGRFELDLMWQKSVGQASGKTRRNQTWRASEKVELWVLK